MTAADVLKIIRAERKEHAAFRDQRHIGAMPSFNRWDVNDAVVTEFDALIMKVTKAMKAAQRKGAKK